MTDMKQTTQNTTRPPIVVILGHVDHGKTSILDTIRKTRVALKESGGITQHVGAYQAVCQDKIITFLDTPGHEAFTAIRSRGAQVADIAVLVVAADEGVKPQTKEAIRIIEETKTPYVVAINKIDKEGANPMRVRQELAEQSVLVEDYGGNVPVVEISAKKDVGIDKLLEMILLVAEVEELQAQTDAPAAGFVLESHLDSRRGIVATLLIHSGTLHIGDFLAAGTALARVKLLEDFAGKPLKTALPSQPCVVLGWEAQPSVGQPFGAHADRSAAASAAIAAQSTAPTALFGRIPQTDLDGKPKRIANLLIKSDVQSSLEAIDHALNSISSPEVDFKVTGFDVGNITVSDIKNAAATKALLLGFRVTADAGVRQQAEREGVRMEIYDIIYELIEAVRRTMSELLDPEIRRTALGRMKVLATFGGTARSQIFGGKVTQGKAVRGAVVSVLRNNVVITTGKLAQLQQSKQDVPEVTEGLEAGIRLDIPNDITEAPFVKESDILDIYKEEKILRSI